MATWESLRKSAKDLKDLTAEELPAAIANLLEAFATEAASLDRELSKLNETVRQGRRE
ncbi:MAG TPA: hypothetical protein VHY20_04840 [Pirellulales bacterium]|jgi:hypothetical protein|nr:hypothetical protein [Pirellulales bacterium]